MKGESRRNIVEKKKSVQGMKSYNGNSVKKKKNDEKESTFSTTVRSHFKIRILTENT